MATILKEHLIINASATFWRGAQKVVLLPAASQSLSKS